MCALDLGLTHPQPLQCARHHVRLTKKLDHLWQLLDLLQIACVDFVLIAREDVDPHNPFVADVALKKLDEQVPRHRP